MLASFLISAVVGIAVGMLSGLLGIGGGTVLVPIFRLLYNMSAVVSTATSLFTIIPTSISGAVSHISRRTCLPKLGIALGIGGAIMSPVGVALAQRSPGWLVMVAAALIIGVSAYKMFRKAIALGKSPAHPAVQDKAQADRVPVVAAAGRGAGRARTDGPDAPADGASAETVRGKAGTAAPAGADGSDTGADVRLTRRQYVTGAGIGLVAGLASGYVGVGGGFIMVPMMLGMLNVPMKLASGTSLIAVIILAIPGTIEQAMLGNIDYLAGIAIACGSIPGAVLGARLVERVPERQLRFLFGCFLLVGAIMLVVKEFL